MGDASNLGPEADGPDAGATLVLVVEDDEAVRELICENLRRDNLALVTAADGAEGVAAYCRHRPQVVLVDLSMPGVDGFEFLRWLQKEPAASRAPALVLTAHGDRASVERALAFGAAGYALKPFDGVALRRRVREMLAAEGPVMV